ncbi:MAG: prepilin peptidase [Planctomycetota bacterium]
MTHLATSLAIEPQLLGGLVVAAAAAIADLRTRRIPNAITVPGTALGLLTALAANQGWLPGTPGVAFGNALATAAGALLLGFACFARRLLGGGDAKLLVAVGAWVGFPALVHVFACSLAAALTMLIAECVVEGRTRVLLRTVVAIPGSWFLPRLRQLADRDLLQVPIPLGAAIAAGTLAWVLQAQRLAGG